MEFCEFHIPALVQNVSTNIGWIARFITHICVPLYAHDYADQCEIQCKTNDIPIIRCCALFRALVHKVRLGLWLCHHFVVQLHRIANLTIN